MTHYASEKLKFEVISRGTFEWLRRFSEGPKCQTYLTLILKSKHIVIICSLKQVFLEFKINLKSKQGPKKVKLPLKVSSLRKVRKKNYFSFGILVPQKHFQANYTQIWPTPWKETHQNQIWASLSKKDSKN